MTGNCLTRFFLVMALSALFVGCVTIPKNNTVNLTRSLTYTLTPPPTGYITKTESHLIEVSYGEQQHRFIAQVEYHQNKIAMAAISVAGAPLFDFIWRTHSPTEINQYVPLTNIDINTIIANMQLCHWPLTQIKSAIQGPNIEVLQHSNLEDKAILWQRNIRQDKQTIIQINKLANGFQFTHLTHHYTIKLTELSQEVI